MMQQHAYYYNTMNTSYYPPNESHQSMSYHQKESLPVRPSSTIDDPQTEEIASFLISLKHSRSVSPEPNDSDIHLHRSSKTITTPLYQQTSSDYDVESMEQEQSVSHPQYEEEFASSSIKRAALPISKSSSTTATATTTNTKEYNWNKLLDNSPLVLVEDRDLVPDSLFVAMSQMKICYLTQADRVGCYKSRDIGFIGMSCKHCGGQPGFGRFYPNSVRSLAQTTTSQTILKHIGSKCRYAPIEVRNAVLELQREQVAQEGLASGRPRYGSRKVFFQRVWARLHGKNASSFTDDDMVSNVSSASSADGISQQSDYDDRSTLSGQSEIIRIQLQQQQQDDSSVIKRKNRFSNSLPLHKNKRIKVIGSTYDV